MVSGPKSRLDAKPIRTQGLVRRVTPFVLCALLVLVGLAWVSLFFNGPASWTQAGAVVLFVALVVVALYAGVLVGRTRTAALAVEQDAGKLREDEAFFRHTVQTAGVGLGLIDADARWVRVNTTLAAILGRAEAQLGSTTLTAVTAEAQKEAVGSALAQLGLGESKRWSGETTQVRADGEQFPVSLSITAVEAGAGEQRLFLVEETDISVAKREEAIGNALVAVRHALATFATWEQAAPHVLGALTAMLGWDVAQFWSLDPEGVEFRLRQSVYRDDEVLADFDRACHALFVSADDGLFARARQSGVPAVNKAVSPQNEPVLGGAAWRASLTQAIGVPVISAGASNAVIVVLSRRSRDLEDDVMTMLSTAGSEVGQFIQRADNTLALQRSEADHRAIFERAPIGIARISAEGELVEGNAALLLMLEHDFETLRGQSWPELLRAYDLAAGKARLAPLLAGISDGGSVQVRAATASGRWLWLQMTATSIPDSNGKPEHVLLMVEDVTTVRDAQDKLAEAYEAQRSANADLEKLDRTKTEFLSIVSHEFRTALTGIQGFSELIRDGGLEPEELRAYGGYIFNDADRVNRLIGDMLDLDRMESGRMSIRMSDVDINEVLSDAIARAASSNTIDFKPDLDPRLPIVTGDRDRLVQVVSNLVNNAVKYSPEGGTVTISSRGEGGYALVTVSDTGLGIPQDEIGHVFERFRRVRSGAAQSIAGTGLGLTIVKQIVEMHGGKIWVESAVGHGSAFHFTVPLAVEVVGPAAQLRHA
jgi:PAS domain S-box-containing protein